MTPGRRCSALGMFAAALVSFAQAKQAGQEHLVDLISQAAVPRNEAAGVVPYERRFTGQHPQGFLSHGKTKDAPSVIVRPPSLDRIGYTVGDVIYFDVIIENVGPKPMKFPTSLDGARVARAMPGATMVALALSFQDEILGSQIVGQQFLYGADPIAQSLVLVRPGERVRIRAQGQWLLQSGARKELPDQWVRNLDIGATVQLTGPGGQYLLASSMSTVSVQLRNSP